jgi:DNA-binding transcriptional LysR family regulator
MAVLPKGHALLAKKRLCLADLADEPFVQYSATASPSMHAVVNLACQRAGFVPRVAQEAVQLYTMTTLVQSGMGVALMPGDCRATFGRNVVFRPLADHKESLATALALVVDPANENPIVTTLLKDFMKMETRRPKRRVSKSRPEV